MKKSQNNLIFILFTFLIFYIPQNICQNNDTLNQEKVLPVLKIPSRSKEAISGSQFMEAINDLSFDERETAIYNEIASGNIPAYLRNLIQIKSSIEDAEGNIHTCIYEVMPDYLSVGSDEDFCRIPMGPLTAQKIADLFGAALPTSKLVDDIYKNSSIKLEPVTYMPVGDENTFVAKFIEHNNAVEKQFQEAGGVKGQLVSGIKKDVVISNKIADPLRPNKVVIYGWHRSGGKAIQPLTNIHTNRYVDYSHGVRLINKMILLDNKLVSIDSVLHDPVLYKILSDEDEPMQQTFYYRNAGYR